MLIAILVQDIGFRHGQEAIRDHRDGGGRVVLAMHRCRKPIIAAINGSAVGVGITQTLPCAIRIAYDKAKIGFVFARRGIVMEACSSFFLPKLVGYVSHLLCSTYESANKKRVEWDEPSI